MAEQLTKELVDAEISSYIAVSSAPQRDDVVRWAWWLEREMDGVGRNIPFYDEERQYKFETGVKATNFAVNWIRENRPDLAERAKQAAFDGIKYRATMR